MKYSVTAIIFSGRENPEWEIDGSLLEFIVQLIKNFPVINSSTEKLPTLGYRGFIIKFSNNNINYFIFRSNIKVIINNEVLWKMDKEHQIEKILINSIPLKFKDIFTT